MEKEIDKLIRKKTKEKYSVNIMEEEKHNKNCGHQNYGVDEEVCDCGDSPARFVEDDVIARNDLEKLKKQRTNLKCIREVLGGFTLSIFYSASQYSKALLKIDELLKEAGF